MISILIELFVELDLMRYQLLCRCFCEKNDEVIYTEHGFLCISYLL